MIGFFCSRIVTTVSHCFVFYIILYCIIVRYLKGFEIIYSADDITSLQNDHEPQGAYCFMM